MDCEDWFQYQEARQVHREQVVLNLWNKGLSPCLIADETNIDVDQIEDIIECEQNYRKGRARDEAMSKL